MGARATAVAQANATVRRVSDLVLRLVAAGHWFCLSHPEDLGRDPRHEHLAASIFQVPMLDALRSLPNISEGATFLCAHGADWAGPTRVVSNLSNLDLLCRHMGPPNFGPELDYLGPLPKWCGHRRRS